MAIFLYNDDLPNDLDLGKIIAIDTEAMGLNNNRDRLCLVQISSGDGNAHLVKFAPNKYEAPNLKKLLIDDSVTKIMHFARFDVSIMYKYLSVLTAPIYCTKIASKIARTYTDKHGLKDLCRELLSINISKEQQSSYWGASGLTKEQMEYAANDVLYLHKLLSKLDFILEREGRSELAQECFKFLPHRAKLDVLGWEQDIFSHS